MTLVHKARGFTLIELLVGMTVALLVIGVVTATFLSQQRSIQALDLSREASNGARDAMLSMQGTIGRAGYGIDPRYAFDFKYYNCTTTPPGCRDKTGAPDEIVFVERDPNYFWSATSTSVQGCDTTTAPCSGHAWSITGFSGNNVTIATHGGENFVKGQLVEMTCAKGQSPVIGEIASWNAPTMTLTVDATNPYKQPPPTGGCFTAAGNSLFLVNRYHYHVVTIAGDPWLMLDRGIDYNQNGTTPENGADLADEIPIAHGVENLQIAYLLQPPPNPWTGSGAAPTAPDNGADWIIGDSPSLVTPEEPDPAASGPLQLTGSTDPSRFTKNPANIRGVRIRVTVRSLLKDLSSPGFQGDPLYPAGTTSIENFSGVANPIDKYRRFFTAVTVNTPNLNSRDPFIF